MKKSKILVPALAMLVMSTAATVTGTVAWFSANSTVTATNMTVKAKANENLLISKSSDVNGSSVASPAKLTGGKSTQTFAPTGDAPELNPTSTVDGTEWFTAKAAESDNYVAAEGSYEQVSSGLDNYRLATTMYLQVYDNTKTAASPVTGKKIYVDYVDVTFNDADKLNTSFRVLVTCMEKTTLNKVFTGPTSATTPTNKGVSEVDSDGEPTLSTISFAAGTIESESTVFKTSSNNVLVAAPEYQTVYEVNVYCYFDGEAADNKTDFIPKELENYVVSVGFTIKA